MKMAFPIQYELIIKESTLKKRNQKRKKIFGEGKTKIKRFPRVTLSQNRPLKKSEMESKSTLL